MKPSEFYLVLSDLDWTFLFISKLDLVTLIRKRKKEHHTSTYVIGAKCNFRQKHEQAHSYMLRQHPIAILE